MASVPSLEENWAIELEKQKQTAAQKKPADLVLQKQQIELEIDQTKKILIEAAKSENLDSVAENYNKIVELLAKQTALMLAKLAQTYGEVSEIVIKNQAKLFIKECRNIATIVDALIKRK